MHTDLPQSDSLLSTCFLCLTVLTVYPVRYSVVYRDRKRLGRKEGARCINTVQTARPQRDTAVAEMDFCWAHAMLSSAGNCAAETDERNGVLKKDASSEWSCCVHFPHPFSSLFFFLNLPAFDPSCVLPSLLTRNSAYLSFSFPSALTLFCTYFNYQRMGPLCTG